MINKQTGRVLFAIISITLLQSYSHFVWAADNVISYEVEEEFEEVKELITDAITEQGLIVTNTLHISDMLNRTADALGIDKPVYKKAESIEFCSAKISHAMTQADPRNLVVCPFTIAIYVLPAMPEQVHIAFSNPNILGGEQGASKLVFSFLDEIAKAGLE
jgi:uncharacterized protein (DUF302 family)